MNPPASPWSPLRNPQFRRLWIVWLVANTCMWMNDTAAAWYMTTLSSDPALVALVQSASTLPVFIVGIAGGALADTVDRRSMLVATQVWVAITAVTIGVLMFAGLLDAHLLLLLVFANGCGLAMRWPVFAAIIPDVVERAQLHTALAMNGVAGNTARMVGPGLAGLLITTAGIPWVFAVIAVASVAAAITLMQRRTRAIERSRDPEAFLSVMLGGPRYVRQSLPLRRVLIRVIAFFAHGAAVIALLPLVAKQLPGGGAGTFSLLFGAMGAGAVITALTLPRLRRRLNTHRLVTTGTLVFAAATVMVGLSNAVALSAVGMFLSGAAWMAVANTLTVSAQLILVDHVRARGMSIYQATLMGASAAGAALWGAVASYVGIHAALVAVAVSAGLALLVVPRIIDAEPSR